MEYLYLSLKIVVLQVIMAVNTQAAGLDDKEAKQSELNLESIRQKYYPYSVVLLSMGSRRRILHFYHDLRYLKP